ADPGVVANRGHIMVMHNGDVHMDAAGFYGLGRTDKRTLIDDPVLVPDPDNPGHMTTDVIASNPNPFRLPPPGVGAHRVMVPVVDGSGNSRVNKYGHALRLVERSGVHA